MKRLILTTTLVAVCAPLPAAARPSAQHGALQTALPPRFSQAPVVDLGRYHVASGTWIPPEVLNITAEVNFYDNTCLPGNNTMFTVDQLTADEILIDVGQMPSFTNPFLQGEAGWYKIRTWRMAVGNSEPDIAGQFGPITATFYFWNRAPSCLGGNSAGSQVPDATIPIPGIPGGGSQGTVFTFIVDISNSIYEFDVLPDGDDVFDGPNVGSPDDTFAWGLNVQRTDGNTLNGPVSIGLGGDPGTVPVSFGCQDASGNPGQAGFIGESTVFLNPTRHVDGSTGFGNLDDRLERFNPLTGVSGCFTLGYSTGLTVPYAGMYGEFCGKIVHADPPVPPPPPEHPSGCNGNGGASAGCTPCPCSNDAPGGTLGGCLNSSATSAQLDGYGLPSVSNDELRFDMRFGNPSTFGVLVSGDNLAPANPANPCFGLASGIQSALLDGLRCVVGNTERHGARPTDAAGDIGLTTNGWGPPSGPPGGLIAQGGFVAGQTRHFQVFYREQDTLVCLTGVNTSQANTVLFEP